jgi:hypothetical protein
MNALTIVLVASGFAFACLEIWGRRRHKHRRVRLADLDRFLGALLTRGFNGGLVVIEIPKTPLFLQFSKYVLKDGRVGLQLDFPVAPWSEKYYDRLKQELDKNGVYYTSQETRAHGVREFLMVDVKQSIGDAATLARTVFHSVFGMSEDTLVTVYFSGVSPTGTVTS